MQYVIRAEFLAWESTLPAPSTNLVSLAERVDVATVAGLRALWSAALGSSAQLPDAPGLPPLPPGDGDCEVSVAEGDLAVAALQARVVLLSDLQYSSVPDVVNIEADVMEEVFVPALQDRGVTIVRTRNQPGGPHVCAAEGWRMLGSESVLVKAVFEDFV